MAAFLKEIEKFYGTKEKNRQGEDLETFLEHYDPRKYETPSCTTDAVIFSITGRASGGESAESASGAKEQSSKHRVLGAARRVCRNEGKSGGYSKTGTGRRDRSQKIFRLEQFAVYGDYDRDPRTRVITTAYLSLVNEQDITVRAGDDAADAAWCSVCLTEKRKSITGEVEQK